VTATLTTSSSSSSSSCYPLSHSINAIGPAPLRSGRKREHCSIVFAIITHIPSLDKILSNAPSSLQHVVSLLHCRATARALRQLIGREMHSLRLSCRLARQRCSSDGITTCGMLYMLTIMCKVSCGCRAVHGGIVTNLSKLQVQGGLVPMASTDWFADRLRPRRVLGGLTACSTRRVGTVPECGSRVVITLTLYRCCLWKCHAELMVVTRIGWLAAAACTHSCSVPAAAVKMSNAGILTWHVTNDPQHPTASTTSKPLTS
jgi:hypothetical protein